MSSASTTCSTCGYVFPERDSTVPCPDCGGTTRTFHVHGSEIRVEIHPGHRTRLDRLGVPGFLVEIKSRVKRSLRGILARDTLVIDRSDALKTVKSHHVEERQPDGSWKTVHDEIEEFKAKRRPE